jgi:hypothetical protein
LPVDARPHARAVFDGGFEWPGIEGAYAWRFDDVPGVAMEIAPDAARTGRSGLAIDFADRVVAFGGVHQALALAPGRYRLEAAALDDLDNPRSFEWRIACRGGSQAPIARLPLARGDDWRTQSIAFAVPPHACEGQALTLVHTARSLAERRLDGRLRIDDVGIFLIR